jgi:exopolysaccharide biosynthesis polyprenyl glycosylphosphotransferase
VITFSNAPHNVLLWLLDECAQLGIRTLVVPRLFERVPARVSVDHVGGLPLLEMHATHPRSLQYAVKDVVDRIAAAALLVLLAPLLLASILAVLVSLGRPVLYAQERVGRDGQRFRMLKFRTMRAAGDAVSALEFLPERAPGGIEGADRRTRVGRFLRATSLDELPQLLNVLNGEMSLVGPRPERPEYVEFFRQHVYRYGERHRVKAGITGWAQIHRLRGKTSIRDRVEWDNYYIENFSLWLDLKILLLTIPAVLRVRSE